MRGISSSTSIIALTIILIKKIVQTQNIPNSEFGYNLPQDVEAVNLRDLFKFPPRSVIKGNDFSVDSNGNPNFGFTTTEQRNSRHVFPGVWQSLTYQDGGNLRVFVRSKQFQLAIFPQEANSRVLARTQYRDYPVGGFCNHDMTWDFDRYIVLVCYDNESSHNFENQIMHYVHFYRPGENEFQALKQQQWFNATVAVTPDYDLGRSGNAYLMVVTGVLDHRQAIPGNPIRDKSCVVIWGRPRPGVTDSTSEPNWGENRIFVMSYAVLNEAQDTWDADNYNPVQLPINNIKYIYDIEIHNKELIVVYKSTSGNIFRVSKCSVTGTDTFTTDGATGINCAEVTNFASTKGITRGGVKYVPKDSGSHYFFYYDGGNNVVGRCSYDFAGGGVTACEESPRTARAGVSFAHFGKCYKQSSHCALYWMNSPEGQFIDYRGTDVLTTTGKPLDYRRHYTATAASQFNAQSVSLVEEEIVGFNGIFSQPELLFYASTTPFNSAANNWPKTWDKVVNQELRDTGTQNQYRLRGTVMESGWGVDILNANNEYTGYYNYTYSIPLDQKDWLGNTLQPSVLTAGDLNHSVLHLNDVKMQIKNETEIIDLVPLGSLGLSVVYNMSNQTWLQINRCNETYNYTVSLVCEELSKTRMNGTSDQNYAYRLENGFDVAIPSTYNYPIEYIQNVYHFKETLVVATRQPADMDDPTSVKNLILYCYIKSSGSWSRANFTNLNTNEDIEFYDVIEYAGDLFIATKPQVVGNNNNGNYRVNIYNARGYNFEIDNTDNTAPNNQRVGLRFVRTIGQNFDGIDDQCTVGINFVKDTSLKLRYLVSCHRESRGGDHQGENWAADYYVFDNSHVTTLNNYWNMTLEPTTATKLKIGCTTWEHVFMVDRDGGSEVVAYNVRHNSYRYFDIENWGVDSIDQIKCAGEMAVLLGQKNNGGENNGNRGVLIVLYGVRIRDARKRAHSMETFPLPLQDLSVTHHEDKLWVRFVMNNRPYYRVAFKEGPYIWLRSSKSQATSDTTLRSTNGITSANKNLALTFVHGDTRVNCSEFNAVPAEVGTFSFEGRSDCTGHVFTNSIINGQEQITIKQRVSPVDPISRRRRILQNQYDNLFTVAGDPNNINTAAGQKTTTSEIFTHFKVKESRMARLSYDSDYYTAISLYNNVDSKIRKINTQLECELVDISNDPINPSTNTNLDYIISYCMYNWRKRVVIFREDFTPTSATPIPTSSTGARGYFEPALDVDRVTIDPIRAETHAITWYNQELQRLNVSVYVISTTTVPNPASGIAYNFLAPEISFSINNGKKNFV